MDRRETERQEIQSFCMLPLDLLTDTRLTPMDRNVAAILVGFAGPGYECRPTYKMLADKVPCSIRTVSASLNKLEDTGWIDRGSGDGESGRNIVLKWTRPGAQYTARTAQWAAGNRAAGWEDCAISGGVSREKAQWAALHSKAEEEKKRVAQVFAQMRAREEAEKLDKLRWGDDGRGLDVERWRDATLIWQYDEGMQKIEKEGLTRALATPEYGNPSYQLFWRTMDRIEAELRRRGLM